MVSIREKGSRLIRIGGTRFIVVVVNNRKQRSSCIRRSFFFLFSKPVTPRLASRPPLLWTRSSPIFQGSSTRDARENNLESTLVAVAAAMVAVCWAAPATENYPIQPSSQPRQPEDIFSTRFSTFFLAARPLYELSGPKLWPAQEPVNCRVHRRESAVPRLLVTSTYTSVRIPGCRLPVGTSPPSPDQRLFGLSSLLSAARARDRASTDYSPLLSYAPTRRGLESRETVVAGRIPRGVSAPSSSGYETRSQHFRAGDPSR